MIVKTELRELKSELEKQSVEANRDMPEGEIAALLIKKIKADPLKFCDDYRNTTKQVLEKLDNADAFWLSTKEIFFRLLTIIIPIADIIHAQQNNVHSVPVHTPEWLELYLARIYDISVRLKLAEDGKQILNDGCLTPQFGVLPETGWDIEPTFNVIANTAHKKVYGYKPDAELTKDEITELDVMIEGERERNIHFSAPSQSDSKTHPLHSNEMCEYIKQRLKNLPLSRMMPPSIGNGVNNEKILRAKIRLFLRLYEHNH